MAYASPTRLRHTPMHAFKKNAMKFEVGLDCHSHKMQVSNKTLEEGQRTMMQSLSRDMQPQFLDEQQQIAHTTASN